jgi:8-oxo-dGTP pyrophosphatase MutT (NUDIX family)
VTTDPPGLADRLRRSLERRAPATVNEGGAQRAAVAVIVTADAEPAMLFVKRNERDGDPWSGHAAFPGGFASSTDSSPTQTAQRETEEETGLPLARVGSLLGFLDDVFPRSVFLPKVIVTPCAFSIPEALPVRPTAEIERALWVPVAELLDPANRRPFTLDLPTGPREFESLHVGGIVIWGLTERVLSQVARALSE